MKRLIHCWGLAVLFLFAANALIACSDDDPMEERTEVPVPPSDEGGARMKETLATLTAKTIRPWKEILLYQ